MELAKEDMDRLRECGNEIQEIMTKYSIATGQITAGAYGPIGQAKYRVANGIQLFLREFN